MVLKLWCKTEDKGSQVLGFTTIDLRPLLAGMSHLSGWYNVVDFTGLCQGQIKCGIQPLTPVEKRPLVTSPQPLTKVCMLKHVMKYNTSVNDTVFVNDTIFSVYVVYNMAEKSNCIVDILLVIWSS